MPSLPLLFHTSQDQTIAWCDGAPVRVREFLADVRRVAQALPAGGHVFNMCTDRYRFAVGLCASILAGKISLLPSAHTPEAVRQLAAFAPDTFCLHDSATCSVALPQFRFPEASHVGAKSDRALNALSTASGSEEEDDEFVVPHIDAAQTVACLFTSGSTGVPVPHAKKWGFLVQCLRTSAARLGLAERGACTLIGTVPPQHMYGFENTVLLALVGGCAFSNRQPFYPGDIASELGALPQPRVLITSPVHLRTLMLAGQALPPVALTVSATAPLAQDLAAQAETALHAPLLEIYGSTETGQIATRRTAHEVAWRLYPGVRLEKRHRARPAAEVDAHLGTQPEAQRIAQDERADDADDSAIWVSGAHVEAPVPMGDALEPLDDNRFLLHGRKADLINIAGKRTSLGYLNHQLNAIPGVVDAVFFMPDDTQGSAGPLRHGELVTRLLAFVVAPGLAAAELQRALRERIDAAFMPRPLIFVDALPRNATGKLPRDVLTAMVAQHTGAARLRVPDAKGAASVSGVPEPAALTFTIPADHPALPGHFPGQPIVPGVVLLDHAITMIGAALGRSLDPCRLTSAKFLHPAAPDQPLTLSFEVAASGAIRFTISAAGRTVASGVLAAPQSASMSSHDTVAA
ncbi:AMP-binding protein [Paraburkholderia sp. DHOC27]|uniref:AMP-binding protein n=1 Tax=Paraburkholderia sp. DHOC27 TaxID=2303330 RepID=UPI000E3BE773|nr:AMP-binding protein [Paraburkholderia sp. DHOC27]RFU45671.1 beta-hydroxyacyl-ACP dehydratase [Paraburkholderia sp. DHOC27]